MTSAQRLLGENLIVFALGVGLLVNLGVAPTFARLRQLWPVGYLIGLSVVGIVGAMLAVISIPFPPLALIVGSIASIALASRRIAHRPTAARERMQRIDRVAASVGVPVLTVAIAWATAQYSSKPLGAWDGWAIWGLKARAIAALGASSHAVLGSSAYDFSHLEYPLFLPALEALGIRAAGGYQSQLVVLQCVLVGVAGLLAIFGLLRDRVRPAVLWPFLLMIASAPTVFGQLASGYADMPMALFLARGFVAGGCWLLESQGPWLILATLFFAAAALCKDEGDLFVAAAYLGLALAARRRRIAVLLSAATTAILLVPWRIFIAVHGFSPSDFQLAKSFDPSWVGNRLDRAPTAASDLIVHAVDVHQYALLLPVGVAALAVGFAFRARPLAVYGTAFALFSTFGLLWIYVISWIPLGIYLPQTDGRTTAGVILSVAALAPLLVSEAWSNLAGGRVAD